MSTDLRPDEKHKLRKQHMCLDFPYSYSISLGEFRCNHSCRMCPMHTHPLKKERYITDAVLTRACEEAGEREVSFEISAYGETFQHPKADDYLLVARKLCPNARIVVATNGSLLNKKRCEKIVDSGINVLSFSLDAGSADTHRWLTGVDNYDRLCCNLEQLIETRNKRGAKHLKIYTHIIGIKELEHEFDTFLESWSEVVDLAYVRTFGNWAGLVDENTVTPATHQKIPRKRYPCVWPWYATKIEPNGDISKCFIHITGDKNPLGNIMTQDLVEIWSGAEINKLRKLHLRGDLDGVEHCPNCMVWSLFPNFWERDANQNWC